MAAQTVPVSFGGVSFVVSPASADEGADQFSLSYAVSCVPSMPTLFTIHDVG